MHIRILQPGDEPDLEAFLQPRVTWSMFLLSNMRAVGLVDRGERLNGTYAAAFEGDQMVAVAMLSWRGDLILMAPVHLAEVAHAAVEGADRPLKGLLGPADQVAAAAEVLSMPTSGAAVQMDEHEGLYTLALDRLVVPRALANGRVRGRRITADDLDLLSDWMTAYATEALGRSPDAQSPAQKRAEMQATLDAGRTWVLEDGGELVATSSFNAAIAEAVQVGGVWTPPDLRGRGYGRCVVAASLLDARADGVPRGVLFTGDRNLPARKAYASIGFERIGDYRILLLRRPIR